MNPFLIYLVTRAHGLHTHLLTEENYRNVLKIKDLNSLVQYLLRTDYGPETSKISSESINSMKLGQVFYSVLMSRVYHLIRIAPRDFRDFLFLYAGRYEMENVKRILRSKRTGNQIGTDMLLPIPREFAIINFSAMIEASTLQDSLEILKATRYSTIIEKTSLLQKYGIQTLLEGALDKIYFKDLEKSLNSIPDNRKVGIIVGTEVDLRNIGLMIDLRARDVDPETVLSISFKSFRLRDEDVNQIARAKPNMVPDIIMKTPYQRFASRLKSTFEEGKVERIEQVINSEIYSKAVSVARESPNDFAYIIGYLQMAEMEAKNLISIATGMELALEEEKIRSMLYL